VLGGVGSVVRAAWAPDAPASGPLGRLSRWASEASTELSLARGEEEARVEPPLVRRAAGGALPVEATLPEVPRPRPLDGTVSRVLRLRGWRLDIVPGPGGDGEYPDDEDWLVPREGVGWLGCGRDEDSLREDLLVMIRGKGTPSEIGTSPRDPATVTSAWSPEGCGWGASEVEAALVLG
jgi:hypothetical protein